LPKKAEAKPKQIKVNIGEKKAGEKTLEAKGPGKAASDLLPQEVRGFIILGGG
jgi:hypothetical protein